MSVISKMANFTSFIVAAVDNALRNVSVSAFENNDTTAMTSIALSTPNYQNVSQSTSFDLSDVNAIVDPHEDPTEDRFPVGRYLILLVPPDLLHNISANGRMDDDVMNQTLTEAGM